MKRAMLQGNAFAPLGCIPFCAAPKEGGLKNKIQIRDANTFNFGLYIPWEYYTGNICVCVKSGAFPVLNNLFSL